MYLTNAVNAIGKWNPFDSLKNIISFFTNINDWIVNFITALFAVVGYIPYALFVGLSYLVVFAETVFKKIAGIESVYITGEASKVTDNIVMEFLFSSEVIRVFISMLIFSVVLLLIFSIIAIVKSEFSLDVKNSAKGPIFGRAFKALVMFISTPVATIMGIYLVSGITRGLNQMMSGSSEGGLHARMFYVAAYSSNRIRNNDDFANMIMQKNKNYKVSATTRDAAAVEIDTMFLNERVIELGQDKYSIEPLKMAELHTLILRGPTGTQTNNGYAYEFSPLKFRMVSYYYDLLQFDYIIGLGSIGFLTYILLSTCIALIKRIFDIVILFLISPAMISLYPLDNGDAAKKINKQMISKVVSVLASVFAFNLYFILLPVFSSIKLFTATSSIAVTSAVSSVAAGASQLGIGILGIAVTLDLIFQAIIVCVGASIVKQASALVSSALGVDDLIKSGTDSAKKIAATAVKAASMATGAGAAVKLGVGALGKGKMGQEAKSKAKREGDDAYYSALDEGKSESQAQAARSSAYKSSYKDSRKDLFKASVGTGLGSISDSAGKLWDAVNGQKKILKEKSVDKDYKELKKTEGLKKNYALNEARQEQKTAETREKRKADVVGAKMEDAGIPEGIDAYSEAKAHSGRVGAVVGGNLGKKVSSSVRVGRNKNAFEKRAARSVKHKEAADQSKGIGKKVFHNAIAGINMNVEGRRAYKKQKSAEELRADLEKSYKEADVVREGIERGTLDNDVNVVDAFTEYGEAVNKAIEDSIQDAQGKNAAADNQKTMTESAKTQVKKLNDKVKKLSETAKAKFKKK